MQTPRPPRAVRPLPLPLALVLAAVGGLLLPGLPGHRLVAARTRRRRPRHRRGRRPRVAGRRPARAGARPHLVPAHAALGRRLRRRAALGGAVGARGALRRPARRGARRRHPSRHGRLARRRAAPGGRRPVGGAGGAARPDAVRRLPVGPAGVLAGGLAAAAAGRPRRRPADHLRRRHRRGALAVGLLRVLGRGLPSGSPRLRLGTRGAALAGSVLAAGAVVAAGLLVPLPTRADAGGRSIRVAGVQGDVPEAGLEFNAERRAVLDNHARGTLDLAQRVAAGTAEQPDVVIWPENSSDIDPYQQADARQVIDSAVDAIGVPTLVGAALRRPVGRLTNASIVWTPGTGPGALYSKRHPVPFGEYIPYRSFFRTFSKQVDLVTQDYVAGHAVGTQQARPGAGRHRHLLRGRLRRADARHRRRRRRPARRADQQRDVRVHRRVGAAGGDVAAARGRARPRRGARVDGGRQRDDRPGRSGARAGRAVHAGGARGHAAAAHQHHARRPGGRVGRGGARGPRPAGCAGHRAGGPAGARQAPVGSSGTVAEQPAAPVLTEAQ
nr:hypothetical protein [Angustibacter aerolatus]